MAQPERVNGRRAGNVLVSAMGVKIPQHVVYRSFAAETVLLNIETGKYYGLNQTAGRMLEALDRYGEVERVVSELAGEFDVADDVLRNDLLSLCSHLAENGLIEFQPDTAA